MNVSLAGCCGGDVRVKQIQVGGATVGLLGLEEVLQQLYVMRCPPGPATADELLALIAARNYVPRAAESEYKAALLREYTAYWTARSKASE
ncbi:MAG: hypothetical protein KKA73_27475 [Chloroflexi bacterium]|nr:hypothetical protein [Chloroflexota bacterium]MBU1751438.1 hypothetical protein [Chloroflexota bacterium]